MKANELMIGDWVKPKNVESFFRVGLIDADSVWDDSDTHEWDYDEIVGIPLTPEILEKNGWRLIPDTRNKLKYLWSTGAIEEYADILIYVGKDHSNVWRWDFPILNIHLYRGDMELTKFRYVHELQHALRLCGIKKEITL